MNPARRTSDSRNESLVRNNIKCLTQGPSRTTTKMVAKQFQGSRPVLSQSITRLECVEQVQRAYGVRCGVHSDAQNVRGGARYVLKCARC
jgi:hypothetical protein